MSEYTGNERRKDCFVYVIGDGVFEISDTVQRLLRDGFVPEHFSADHSNVNKTRYVRGDEVVYLIRFDRRTKNHLGQKFLRMGNPPTIEDGEEVMQNER